MQMNFADERLLAVVAHPDDAELLCAGTLARARRDGAAAAVCVMCRGDKGQPVEKIADLGALRRREMEAAAAILGADLFCGEVPDGELADSPAARETLVEVFRQFGPTLVLAHAPEDYHADHRAASALAEAVSWYAASPGQESRTPPLEAAPAVWWMDCVELLGPAPGFYIDVSDFLELKQRMLACHASQLARAGDGSFSSLEELMLRQCRTRGAQAGVAAAEAFRVHSAWKRVRAW